MTRTISAFVAAIMITLALVAPRPTAFAQSQTQMNVDAATEYKKADAELNTVYKKLLARLDKEGQAKLKRAQRAWIAYRNAEVEVAADTARGGSMMPMVASNAAARITKSRTKELQAYITEYQNR